MPKRKTIKTKGVGMEKNSGKEHVWFYRCDCGRLEVVRGDSPSVELGKCCILGDRDEFQEGVIVMNISGKTMDL